MARLPKLAVLMILSWLFTGVAVAQQVKAPALLRFESDPTGVLLTFDRNTLALSTPAESLFSPGSYHIEASQAGYQNLAYNLNVNPGDTMTANFILLADKPIRPTPEDLGLSYQPVIPLLPEDQAQAVRGKYNLLAQIFAIIPLSHGIMVQVALGDNNDYHTKELIAGGLILSASSYLLGRLMASRRLKDIREENNMLTVQNGKAKEHNKDIERAIRQAHTDAVSLWQAETSWRGRVEISK